jgi:type III pantothenate kinase
VEKEKWGKDALCRVNRLFVSLIISTFAPNMNLVIDAGNTLIKTAIYNHDQLIAVDIHVGWTVEGIASFIDKHPGIDSCLVCSTRALPDWLPDVIRSKNIAYQELSHLMKLPITIGYETPETLGKDRIAAAVGAATLFPGQNVLAIDAGTALTIDYISDKGYFLGGNISPGLRMRFTSLNQQTFSLPDVELSEEVPLLGKNTREAILAGVVNGLTHEIDNSINALKNKYNDLHVIITGGDARYLSTRLKNTIFVEENLVLSGLNAILRNFSL